VLCVCVCVAFIVTAIETQDTRKKKGKKNVVMVDGACAYRERQIKLIRNSRRKKAKRKEEDDDDEYNNNAPLS
jgi:hypothetical protein